MTDNIRKIVKKLIKKYHTRNPIEIAEKLGIWVYILPLGKTKGHYLYAKRKKVFFINENLSEKERLFCIAHELGHALLHSKQNVYFNNSNTFFNTHKHEIEADTFAAELILEDNIFENYEGFNLSVIAKCEQVEEKFLQYKYNVNKLN